MQWALCPFCLQVPCGHAEEYSYLASSWSLMRAKVGKKKFWCGKRLLEAAEVIGIVRVSEEACVFQ